MADRTPTIRAAPPGDPNALPAGFAVLAGEICGLKRVETSAPPFGSLADTGFRRAVARLDAGDAADDVALTEIVFVCAHCALGAVDAGALQTAGVAEADRLLIYRRAAERVLGDLPGPLAQAARPLARERGAPALSGSIGALVGALASSVIAPADDAGGMPVHEELVSEQAYTAAALAALVAYTRGSAPGRAFTLALAHPLGAPLGPDLPRALAAIVAGIDVSDTADPSANAFQTAFIVERVLQQRHHANVAGLSLTEAMEARDLVPPGPVEAFHRDVVRRLRLSF